MTNFHFRGLRFATSNHCTAHFELFWYKFLVNALLIFTVGAWKKRIALQFSVIYESNQNPQM